jgi:hypothetical protein
MATLIYAGNKHNYDGTSQLEVASGAVQMGASGVFTAAEQNNLQNNYFLHAPGSAGITVANGPPTVQTVMLYCYPGSSFSLTFGANSTLALSIKSTAAQVQAALQGLASIGAGNITVTGPAGGPYICTFAGSKAGTVQAAMLVAGSALATNPDLTSGQYAFNYLVKSPTHP